MPNTETNTTKVVTGLVRFSYAHVFEAQSINGSDPKFSVSLIIPKSDTETINAINKAIAAATQLGIPKFGGKVPPTIKTPLRDGLERDDEAYTDSYFINANCKTAPGVVDKNRRPIIDSTEFYSGCYGMASITFYAFNTNGNKGIACGLNNVMKVKDGDPLGGRSRAEDDFADIVLDDTEDDFLN